MNAVGPLQYYTFKYEWEKNSISAVPAICKAHVSQSQQGIDWIRGKRL